jgi:hypothetical protein
MIELEVSINHYPASFDQQENNLIYYKRINNSLKEDFNH